MKKILYFFIPLLLLSIFVLNGCTNVNTETNDVKVYTVFFHDNYQGNYAKIVVEAGDTVSLPADPSRTGYEFEGWMLSGDENTTDAFDNTQPINSTLTVFAKWSRNVNVSLVTLKFMNYRTADEVFAVENGSLFVEPVTPVYDENETYAFVNWFTDIECTQVYDFNSEVNSDLTLYAGWNKQIAHITLDYNFAGSPAPVTAAVRIGETVNQIILPTRDLYEFSGWYTARVDGTLFDINSPVYADMTIYAHWVRSSYNVTFNTNTATLGTGINLNYVVSKGASIETEAGAIVSGMTLTGHDFAGWYLIQINPNSENPLPQEYLADLSSINNDMTIYAAWTLHTYQIEFDYNYAGAPAQPENQSIKYLNYVQSVSVTSRDGYTFGGWFTEPECINQFTLDDTPVSADMTLYAKWVEDVVQNDVTVTYVYNLGAGQVEYAHLQVPYNGTVGTNSPQDPNIENYIFVGWYKSTSYVTKFSNSSNLTQDITVYAKMLKKYTFEAEATDLTGKIGFGTSTNSFEEELIMDYTFIGDGSPSGVSGGYLVRELYYYGATLDFVIEAEADETDAVLYLRISSESYVFFGAKSKEPGGQLYNYLSDTEFKIVVNGTWSSEGEPLTWLNYGGLYMPMANTIEPGDLDPHKTPFETVLIMTGLTLHQGTNYITLFVSNNNNHGGTFHSEAPMIDCIYIYSSVNLTMHDYEFYLLDGVKTLK